MISDAPPGTSSCKAMTTDAPPSRRVLLLAGCLADAVPSMGLAVAVATRMRARLEGVLALDPRAEAAALVTIGPGGRAGPAPGGAPLRLACAADARAFRHRLDVAAAGASLPWGFRIGMGLPSELALAMRQPRDAVIVGHRRFLSLRGPLVSLAGSDSDPTAHLATDLARVLGLRLRLLPVETPPSEIELLAASAIVLPRALGENPPSLNMLMDVARCPVLLDAAE